MIVHDKNIAYRRDRLYVPYNNFGLGAVGATAATALVGVISGLKVTAAGTAYEGVVKLPHNVDPQFALYSRIHLAGDGTDPSAVGTLTHKGLYSLKKNGEAGAATAAGAPVSDFSVMAALSATPHVHTWSARSQVFNPGFASREEISEGCLLQFSLELDAVGGTIGATNFVVYLGMEFDYMPMNTRAPHSQLDGPWGTDFA